MLGISRYTLLLFLPEQQPASLLFSLRGLETFGVNKTAAAGWSHLARYNNEMYLDCLRPGLSLWIIPEFYV